VEVDPDKRMYFAEGGRHLLGREPRRESEVRQRVGEAHVAGTRGTDAVDH